MISSSFSILACSHNDGCNSKQTKYQYRIMIRMERENITDKEECFESVHVRQAT